MSLGKKTINLVKKVLRNENKRKMYTQEELHYMEVQLQRLIDNRKARKAQRKAQKGFDSDKPINSSGNTENYDD
jgi:hypothetical protein